MSTALHILVGHQNVVGWQLVFIYMRTPPTHYYIESSGQVASLETHPKQTTPMDLVLVCHSCLDNINEQALKLICCEKLSMLEKINFLT